MIYTIYKHTNKINNKCYIGITHYKDLKIRWAYGQGYKKQPKFYNAIKKYGWENFTHEIICECDESEVDFLERLFIEKYNSIHNGYNQMSGGKIYSYHSEETKKKISEHNAKPFLGKHHTEETKEKNRKWHKEHPVKYWLGKHITKDMKERNRIAHLGKKASEETKKKQSIAFKGRHWIIIEGKRKWLK